MSLFFVIRLFILTLYFGVNHPRVWRQTAERDAGGHETGLSAPGAVRSLSWQAGTGTAASRRRSYTNTHCQRAEDLHLSKGKESKTKSKTCVCVMAPSVLSILCLPRSHWQQVVVPLVCLLLQRVGGNLSVRRGLLAAPRAAHKVAAVLKKQINY